MAEEDGLKLFVSSAADGVGDTVDCKVLISVARIRAPQQSRHRYKLRHKTRQYRRHPPQKG